MSKNTAFGMMEKPDFKNNKIVKWGRWIILILFLVQPIASFFDGGKQLRIPLTCVFIGCALLLISYMVIVAYKGGYKKYAISMGAGALVLIAIVALLLWAIATTPGAGSLWG